MPEVELALESLREMQSNVEREVEWVLTDREEFRQNAAMYSHLSAINIAISNMINFLENTNEAR
jgi:spore coat polysaccharide biosynthesis protein SpsF (cytidylyltransferase family)